VTGQGVEGRREAPARRSVSVEETESLGRALAPALAPGDVVVLSGPLGAGKTRFVAGVARGLGCTSRVRSPSFTLVSTHAGRIPLVHLDLYRLDGSEVPALGLEEALERGTLLAEWGEALPPFLAAEALTVRFENAGENERLLFASALRGRGLELLDAWCAAAASGAGR
jgi:tRNA threonylcarbamoyladenosine biosynthesis protein TsaE